MNATAALEKFETLDRDPVAVQVFLDWLEDGDFDMSLIRTFLEMLPADLQVHPNAIRIAVLVCVYAERAGCRDVRIVRRPGFEFSFLFVTERRTTILPLAYYSIELDEHVKLIESYLFGGEWKAMGPS